MQTKRLLSLFSGCGGMDLGFEGDFNVHISSVNPFIHPEWIMNNLNSSWIKLPKTTFETVFANDINKHAMTAWTNYFCKKKQYYKNETFKLASIVDLCKEYREGNTQVFPSDVDIVTGGFPCQDFSIAGKRKGFNSHKSHLGTLCEHDTPLAETRGQLYMWMKEVIEITKPKVFIAENVKGLVNLHDAKEVIQKDFSSIGNNGYFLFEPRVLNASNFGVPQNRERVFFIGLRKDLLNKDVLEVLETNQIPVELDPYPTPTHTSSYGLFSQKLKSNVCLKEIFEDLQEPEYSLDVSQQFFSKAKFMGKHCQGQTEVNLNGVGPTIRSEHHGNIEYRRLSNEHGGQNLEELKSGLQERRLTLRECARVQTFPDTFDFVIPHKEKQNKFELSSSNGYKLVGNAVPPLLAFHIAKRIETLWDTYFNQNETIKQDKCKQKNKELILEAV